MAKRQKCKAHRRRYCEECSPTGSSTLSDMGIYKKFVVHAILGHLPTADQLLHKHQGVIESVARQLDREISTPHQPLYRGVILARGHPGGPLLCDSAFVSFSDDKNVACWFARPDSWISTKVQAGSNPNGWVAEYLPTSSDVILFHHLWIPELINRSPTWDSIADLIASETPRKPGQTAQEHRDGLAFEFNVHLGRKPQREIILKGGMTIMLQPVDAVGCPDAGVLDSQFRNHPDWVDAPPGLQSVGVAPGTRLRIVRVETVPLQMCGGCGQRAIDMYLYLDKANLILMKCTNCEGGGFAQKTPHSRRNPSYSEFEFEDDRCSLCGGFIC